MNEEVFGAGGDRSADSRQREPFEMKFDIGTIKHLGLQMYSTLPPVIGELVSNAWDADATTVDIRIPVGAITEGDELTITDDGCGMTDQQVRDAYLVVGRDRRKKDGTDESLLLHRKVMGRKGIGKFSAFGIAEEIEIETVNATANSRFKMNYSDLSREADRRSILMPVLPPTGNVSEGTKVTLRGLRKFRGRSISVQQIRRGLARRFSIIGPQSDFEVVINGTAISPQERDMQRLLEVDSNGSKYIWNYDNLEIEPNSNWKVSGWIGALDRTRQLEDGIQRGIVIMARGKMVQEPFTFNALVGQQFALSYLVGELNAEFVDEAEDTVGTTRNSLVWDTPANTALLEWGQKEVNRVAREWAEKRNQDNEAALAVNTVYQRFVHNADQFSNRQIRRVADQLVKGVLKQNPLADEQELESVVQMCLDFMEFDAFNDFASDLAAADVQDVGRLVNLFREWEVVEAKEMMRVTQGRITTIEKLQNLIETNALEVPTLHNFLKEFPWVIDPRWTLVADERTYSQLLRTQFPQPSDTPDDDKRIDFLCVQESNNLIVLEIKRPQSRISIKELNQVEEYVNFMRDHVSKTTDPAMSNREVVGYILCGDTVDTYVVRGKISNLAKAAVFVRKYSDLLRMVENSHREFLERYNQLKEAKRGR